MTIRPIALSLAVALAACDGVTFQTSSPSGAPPSDAPAADAWGDMLDAVNETRLSGASCGGEAQPPVAPLAWSAPLAQAAQAHADDLATHDLFSHTGTDGSSPGDRVAEAGYPWSVVGENIARYQPTVEEVVEDWLASPEHCRQIMDPAFVEMGAAERDRYWVQVFAAPL